MNKKFLIILILSISIFAANTSYQKNSVEYFDQVKVVYLKVLSGEISFSDSEEDIEIKSVIFYDAGKLEDSRKLVQSSFLKSYKKGDTLMVMADLPLDKLGKIHERELRNPFAKSYNVKFDRHDIEITPRSGIEHFIDIKMAVPESVEVICDYGTSRIVLDGINFPVKFRGRYLKVEGDIAPKGKFELNSVEAFTEMNNIDGKCKIKTSHNCKFHLKGEMNGYIDINIPDGEVRLDVNGAPKRFNIEQKSGRMVYFGNCAENANFIFGNVVAEMEFEKGGDLSVKSKSGSILLHAKPNSFSEFDISCMNNEIDYYFPEIYNFEGNTKKFIAKARDFSDYSIFIRSENAEMKIKVFE